MSRLVAAGITFALLVASCSGSEADSQNLVPLDTPAPGVLYVSTVAGDIQAVALADAEARVFVEASGPDQTPVVDLAPTPDGKGLHALVRVPGQPVTTALTQVTELRLDPIETTSDALACIDPHANAATALVHEARTSSPVGTQFAAIAVANGTAPRGDFDSGDIDSGDIDIVSVACPRWSANRDMVATATPTRNPDPSSIVTVVQNAAGDRYQIEFEGCGTTPTSFSPNDEFLAVALTCYALAWETSGLYLIPVDRLDDPPELRELTKLGNGLFGRTSWHVDGRWIATVRADAIVNQNIAVDLGAQPVGLQVIEVSTRQTINVGLANDADPFSVVWLDDYLDN